MNQLRAALKLWLKLECQMITTCSAGLLVKSSDKHNQTVMAGWPDKKSINKTMIQAALEVNSKKRLHLEKAENQDKHVYLGHPIFINDVFWGAIVLHLEKPGSKDMQAVIRILQWGITWLRFLLHQHEIETTGSTLSQNSGSERLITLLAIALQEKSIDEMAIAVANYIASLFQFDRVSLGVLQDKKVQLKAVSFSAGFDARTQPMQNLINAMDEAITQGVSIQSKTGNNESDEPKRITRCHDILLQQHGLKHTQTYLIRNDKQVFGALTIEQTKNDHVTKDAHSYIANSLKLVASILELKLQAQMGLKKKFRQKSVDTIRGIFGTEKPVEKLLGVVALVFLIAMFIPVNYRVTSDAVLQSINKHLVVSPYDGFIGEVYIKPGDSVDKEQLLVSLKDDDLRLERRRISSQLQQYRLEYDKALGTGDRAQAAIYNAQVEKGVAELQLIEQQLERTQLKSPINGVIISDDISQSLGAPTKQGDVLVEVADSSEFFVQLFVNEKDIADINVGQGGSLSLASLPGEKFPFVVERITPISELKDGKNYFRLNAELTAPTQQLRPGMTGNGKIDIEKRTIGWIWFHEIWHWLRLTFWF